MAGPLDLGFFALPAIFAGAGTASLADTASLVTEAFGPDFAWLLDPVFRVDFGFVVSAADGGSAGAASAVRIEVSSGTTMAGAGGSTRTG